VIVQRSPGNASLDPDSRVPHRPDACAFHMPPTNITLAQAQRVKGQGKQGKLL